VFRPASRWSAEETTGQISSDLISGSSLLARGVLSFDLACLWRVVFFWFWVLSFDLACLRRVIFSWLSVLSFDLVRLQRVIFSWLAALSLKLACPRRFLPWIGVLSFDLVLRFVFFSWLAALSFLYVVSLWLVACVCVFAPSLARALGYSARALSPLQRGCPCFEAKRARMS
jgi:hypothetical protein